VTVRYFSLEIPLFLGWKNATSLCLTVRRWRHTIPVQLLKLKQKLDIHIGKDIGAFFCGLRKHCQFKKEEHD